MEWSTLKTCISDCIKHNATTCNIGCKDQISLKDTPLFTQMGKILDYKHVKLICITNVFNMKLDKLKCELKWEDFCCHLIRIHKLSANEREAKRPKYNLEVSK